MLSLQINTVEFRQLEALSLFAPSQNFCETESQDYTESPEDTVKADGIHICFYIPRIQTFIVINYVRWLWEIKSCT